MHGVAGGAAFPQGLVFEHKRPELCRVTLTAGLVLRKQRSPSGLHRRALVGVVAVPATHLAFEHRMMVRQVELPALVQMALEAGFGRFARVDDGVARAARLIVNAAGTVARLAPDVLGVVARRLESRVGGGLEIPDDLIVALGAGLRPHEFGARYIRRRQHGSVDRGAGDGDERHCQHDGNRAQPSANGVSLPGITLLSRQIV